MRVEWMFFTEEVRQVLLNDIYMVWKDTSNNLALDLNKELKAVIFAQISRNRIAIFIISKVQERWWIT